METTLILLILGSIIFIAIMLKIHNNRNKEIKDRLNKGMNNAIKFQNYKYEPKDEMYKEFYSVPKLPYFKFEYENNFVDEFISLDIETTGLDHTESEIIEIAAVHFKDGLKIAKYSQLIKPFKRITDYITNINGISNYMVENKPCVYEIFPEFISFIKNYSLVAHNAEFDMKFILSVANDMNIVIKNKVIDTLSLSRKYIKGAYNHKLGTLANYLKLPATPNHRAYDDALTTAYLYLNIKNNIKDNNLEINNKQYKFQQNYNSMKEQWKIDKINMILKLKKNYGDDLEEFELECFEVVKKIILESMGNYEMLAYYKGNYFDIRAFCDILRIKNSSRLRYVLISEDIEKLVQTGLEIKDSIKSEYGYRVMITNANDLYHFKEYIIEKYKKGINELNYYMERYNIKNEDIE